MTAAWVAVWLLLAGLGLWAALELARCAVAWREERRRNR